MLQMLCRNRVKDFTKWKAIFDSHKLDQETTGLTLTKMWQSDDDPNNVFFIFDVSDKEKALAFMNHPDSAKAGEESGVIDGKCHFLIEYDI